MGSRILNMKNSSWRFGARFGRGVNQQRTHRHYPTFWHHAINRSKLVCEAVNTIVAQHAECVSSRQNSERSIISARIVQVNPECQNLTEYFGRGVGIRNSLLRRPPTPSRRFVLVPQRQGSILMPYHEPIRIRGFVEDGCAKWKRAWPQYFAGQLFHRWVSRDQPNRPKQHRMAKTRAAPHGRSSNVLIQGLVHPVRWNNIGPDRKASCLDLITPFHGTIAPRRAAPARTPPSRA